MNQNKTIYILQYEFWYINYILVQWIILKWFLVILTF